MRRVKQGLIYSGVAIFLVHSYRSEMSAADRVWLRAIVTEAWDVASSAVLDIAWMVWAALAWLLLATWQAVAPYVMDALLIGGVAIVGVAIYVYAINQREMTAQRIDESIEELGGLI